MTKGKTVAKKSRLSRDQKRKSKLTRERKEHRESSVLPYKGNTYKSPELIPTLFRTELGIHEADVMSERSLTDNDVRAALEQLVLGLRQGPLPPQDDSNRFSDTGSQADLIVWNIRQNWKDLYRESPNPGRDKLIGVLRTLLDSINTWSTPSPASRGYLHFIEGFLKKQGASVRIVDENMEEVEGENGEDELLKVGRAAYLSNDPVAIEKFSKRVMQLTASGQVERVVNVCQQLMGEVGVNRPLARELSSLSMAAQQALPQLPHERG
jgi:hypothetical protein